MKRLSLALALWASLSFAAVAQVGGLSFPGPGPGHSTGGGGSLTVVDTSSTTTRSSPNSTIKVCETTACQAGDVIVIFAAVNGSLGITSISSPSISWNQRANCSPTCSGESAEFVGRAVGAVSNETVTIVWNAAISYAQNCSIAIRGVNSGAFPAMFDPNASLPSITAGGATASTTNSVTAGVSSQRLNTATRGSVDTGWTGYTDTNFLFCEYKNPTTGNSLTVTDPTGGSAVLLDAVTQ